MKDRYYLIGHPLTHSYSPLIHSYLADYDYSLADITEDMLGDFLRNGEWKGLNVTIPYKKAVMEYLDVLSPEAAMIGSVNTVVRRDGKLYGHNTDYYGFRYMIDSSGFDLHGKKVLILGSGGSSLTVKAVAADSGARETVVVSRSGRVDYTNVYEHGDADYIVNTTPVGMYPGCGVSPVDLSRFTALSGVIDLIYNPSRTKLVLDAMEKGIPAVSGLKMLVAQAKRSAELFSSSTIDDIIVDNVFSRIRREKENIILTGMPGCGKSTVGRLLSSMTGRSFCDTDEEITASEGITPAAMISAFGEERFREAETRILESVSKQSSMVISAGGGAVTRPGNIRLMKQNGTVVFLRRALDGLETSGRPLSEKTGVTALWEERRDLYLSSADIIIDVCPTPGETAGKILKELSL